MRYVLLFLLSSFILTAQDSKDLEFYDITYQYTYYSKASSKTPRIELASVFMKDSIRVFQMDKNRKLDSLKFLGIASDNDRSTYFTKNRYTIEWHGDTVTYFEESGNYSYYYTERLKHRWQLVNETKTINGIACRKATVNYGGRSWTAWYAVSLPMNAGPYKFQGLPGLIVKISDTTGIYDFELVSLKKEPYLLLKKYPVTNSTLEAVKTERLTFNELKSKWQKLSLNESMALMANPNQGMFSISLDTNSSNIDMSALGNRSVTDINYIEIDHE